MKILYNFICVWICIFTLGIVDVRVKYADGTKFEWVGWVSRFNRWKEG